MLVSDLLHSCTNDRVAAAAVSSIGGAFALRVQSSAEDHGLTTGAYAARRVREFAVGATEREWRELCFAVRGHDHPVLRGLEIILDRRIARSTTERPLGVPAAILAASAAA